MYVRLETVAHFFHAGPALYCIIIIVVPHYWLLLKPGTYLVYDFRGIIRLRIALVVCFISPVIYILCC